MQALHEPLLDASPSAVRFEQLAPNAERAMRGLHGALWLEPRLRELVEIRTAQLDGCATRLAAHAQEALELGETQQRLAALAGWRNSRLFSARERAALALVEALAPPNPHAIGAAREEAAGLFDEGELAQLLFACVAAAAWDRLELALGDTLARPLHELG